VSGTVFVRQSSGFFALAAVAFDACAFDACAFDACAFAAAKTGGAAATIGATAALIYNKRQAGDKHGGKGGDKLRNNEKPKKKRYNAA
jgi:hypothetical protein